MQGINYNDIKHNRISKSYRALWRAVIMQALLDATRVSKKTEEKMHKKQAIKWLRANSINFLLICDRAELDPAYVRRCSRKVLTRGRTWRRPRAGNKAII
ncbi:MAG: hypothetical protein JSS50_02855 [Proteobacteria bacterium]|nr:hypothetical protein [Pseudomonadota bacterium]